MNLVLYELYRTNGEIVNIEQGHNKNFILRLPKFLSLIMNGNMLRR
jgi:hypothetical protein